ncbi:MAG: glycosyl transferase family 1 [Bacteroidetes bacterium HGW-Bacteroidetes-21]|jgi:glycosyltransferase involved in cell wall biosynthesis|nr:MAG: glycosyl transferase family 1 [Bacteroidetes bacterium HGW-Bacteroidetes-21]
MRIGFDAKRAFFNNTGLGNYSRNTIRQLTICFPENEYLLYVPKKKIRVEFDYGVARTIFPESFTGKCFPSYWRSFLINSQLYSDNPHIYHGLSNELPFGIDKMNCKKIVTIHDLIFIRYPELYKPIDRKMYLKKFSNAARVADIVIAVSQQTKRDLVEFLKVPEDKIRVVYQGCNPVFYQECPSEILEKARTEYDLPKEFILYVGTIEERKNLLLAIKALNEGHVKVPLVAIGRKTDYFQQIEAYLSGCSAEFKRQIIFIDNLPNEMLRAFYKLAKVFVYPSVFEGFGIPILEALASGTPVITSKGSCFSEAGGPGSLYVDPKNPVEMADALKAVLGSEDQRKTMICEGLKYASDFTDEKVAVNMMTVYQEVTGIKNNVSFD